LDSRGSVRDRWSLYDTHGSPLEHQQVNVGPGICPLISRVLGLDQATDDDPFSLPFSV